MVGDNSLVLYNDKSLFIYTLGIGNKIKNIQKFESKIKEILIFNI
jgi:hypothetical protein